MRYPVILIREGKSKNGNRWTRRMLDRIAEMAPGLPVRVYDMSQEGDRSNLGHWAQLRAALPPGIAKTLPEEIPGAELGTIAAAHVREDAQGALVGGELEIPENERTGWFRSFLDRAKAIGRTLGLSIHVPAGGLDGTQIEGGGIEPTAIHRISGFDVVTWPSAGGAFEAILEALTEERPMKWKDLLARLWRFVPAAKRAALEGITPVPAADAVITVQKLLEGFPAWGKAFFEATGMTVPAESMAPTLEALAAAPDMPAAAPPAPAPGGNPTPNPAPTPGTGTSEGARTAWTDDRLTALDASVRGILLQGARSLVEAQIAAANLPEGPRTFARQQLLAVVEANPLTTAAVIEKFIADLKKGLGASSTGTGGGTLEGAPGPSFAFPEYSNANHFLAAFEAMMLNQREGVILDAAGNRVATVPALYSIRKAYGILTGDVYCEGLPFYQRARGQRSRGLFESVAGSTAIAKDPYFVAYSALTGRSIVESTTATFPLLLSAYMHKAMLRDYLQQSFQWNLIARMEPVTDFKTWRWLRQGEYPNLPVVAEDAAYLQLASVPSEEEITLAIQKRGGLDVITWEMIVNDDLAQMRRIPGKLARAAARTLHQSVFGLLLTNAAIYDTVALAHATHANLTASALSLANLKSMRKKMVLQKDLDAKEAGRAVPRRLLTGPSTHDIGYDLIYSPNKPSLSSTGSDTNQAAGTARTITNTADNMNTPNILRGDYGLEEHEILYFEDVDNDQYWLTADPNVNDMIIVGALNGNLEPAIFVQDLERVGSFFDRERITYKIRQIYKAVVADFRGFQGGIP